MTRRQPVLGNLSGDQMLYADTSTVTSVTANDAAAETLLAENLRRKGGFVVNDSDKDMYLKFGTAASATSFTDKVAAGGKFNLADGTRVYTGIITARWAAGPTGAARSTELS